ncbi:MAG: PhaM family polyhydroxyalkanoate granule multifunctional regulatory protein [Burkholderiaceae bacterium]
MPTKRLELPFANPIGDSLELMKKMWGFAGLPGIPTASNLASMAARIPQQLPSMMVPTLDVDELEKRIADLRAVEQWLELNAKLLRTTIQSLEVQRATIATLKGIGGAMMTPMFNRSVSSSKPPPEVTLGLAAMTTEETKAAATAPAVRAPKRAARSNPGARTPAQESAPTAAPVNPLAWWNSLQDQFARIAATASSPSTPQPVARKAAKKDAQRRPAKKGR